MSNELKAFITNIGLDKDARSKVLEKLQELGVECIDDLQYLKESDLTVSNIMKPIHVRKLLDRIAGFQAQPPMSSKSCSLDSENYNRGNLEGLPQPCPKLPVTVVPGTVNVKTLLSKITEFPVQVLSKGRLETNERRHFIRAVVDEVRKISKHFPKRHFEEIASQIVRMYPESFEDRIDNIRVGTGHDSIMKQLISRNENLNRNCDPQKKKNESTASLSNSKSDEEKSIRKRKSMYNTDMYGCVNWGPVVTNEEEEFQETLRKDMEKMYGCEPVDWESIYEKMEKTFPLQRKHINEGKTLQELKPEWPFMTEENVMLQHCQALVGIKLTEVLSESYLKKGGRMLRYFKSRQAVQCQLQKYLNEVEVEREMDNVTALLPAVIQCLQVCLGEKESSLFLIVDEMSSTDEVERLNEKNWPRLAMLGESTMSAKFSMLLVDGHVVGRYASFLTAFALLFGAYYMFNIEYPPEAAVTLEFAQRCFFGINPDSGSKTVKKKKTSATHPKVLKLINDLADYEWKA